MYKCQTFQYVFENIKPGPKDRQLLLLGKGKYRTIPIGKHAVKFTLLPLLLFRSDASRSELAELSKRANPDEIDIDLDDSDESEDNEPDGKRKDGNAAAFFWCYGC